ncbi:bifunctional (p)ppGpp synthetase/guanosine-3',5'-bis(diphosphate) 3'-pyrophosphohydrolase [Candidatus Uhrbacteria bacterium]|nr:bifunctional (p)ppGpp synthetase/guanosine-3',5'-bis(diphosphate) 3'-pyrophosphohydrolase [Candidatus Uhrbacteria bacterium]
MPVNPTEQKTLDTLCADVLAYDPQADITTLKRAYQFADEAHGGQKRATGEPYIVHPLATAFTLAEMRLPVPILIAGILHDIPEDTQRTLEDVRAAFGDDVASMVAGITKLGKIKYRGMERYIENLRKMFLAMAADVRVVFIKFADRLHNLETLEVIPPKKQYRIALESLEIYAPIANRLGMGEMKGRLEDAAFKYIYPKEYEWAKNLAKTTREDKQEYLDRVTRLTQETLEQAGLKNVRLHGREKHLYSLYRKLLKNERSIARIYDLIALRIIVDSVADCYAALGIIHSRWTPLKGRIKDYIAQPKPNGYRSLHTTVFCEDGEIVEFQIRTKAMHEEDEFGIAAHWAYDEQGKYRTSTSPMGGAPPAWVHELADIQQELADKKQFVQSLEDIKIDIFHDRIFVFTPKGDVIDLPEDSTCVDLAYAIHTEIGNTCTGAKVNEEVTPLDRVLKNGDMVEILTDKSRKGPNPDWNKFVKTRHAKVKIRQFARSKISSWIKGILPGTK